MDILIIEKQLAQLFICLYLFLIIYYELLSSSTDLHLVHYFFPSYLIIHFCLKTFIIREEYKSKVRIYQHLKSYSENTRSLRYEVIIFLICLVYNVLEYFRFYPGISDSIVVQINEKYLFINNLTLALLIVLNNGSSIVYFLFSWKREKSLKENSEDMYLKYNKYYDIFNLFGVTIFLSYMMFLYIFVDINQNDLKNIPIKDLNKYDTTFFIYGFLFSIYLFIDNYVFYLKLYNSNLYFYYLQNKSFFPLLNFLFGRKSIKKPEYLPPAQIKHIFENFEKYKTDTYTCTSNISSSVNLNNKVELNKSEPEINNEQAKEICCKLELYFEDYVIINSNLLFEKIFRGLHGFYTKYTGSFIEEQEEQDEYNEENKADDLILVKDNDLEDDLINKISNERQNQNLSLHHKDLQMEMNKKDNENFELENKLKVNGLDNSTARARQNNIINEEDEDFYIESYLMDEIVEVICGNDKEYIKSYFLEIKKSLISHTAKPQENKADTNILLKNWVETLNCNRQDNFSINTYDNMFTIEFVEESNFYKDDQYIKKYLNHQKQNSRSFLPSIYGIFKIDITEQKTINIIVYKNTLNTDIPEDFYQSWDIISFDKKRSKPKVISSSRKNESLFVNTDVVLLGEKILSLYDYNEFITSLKCDLNFLKENKLDNVCLRMIIYETSSDNKEELEGEEQDQEHNEALEEIGELEEIKEKDEENYKEDKEKEDEEKKVDNLGEEGKVGEAEEVRETLPKRKKSIKSKSVFSKGLSKFSEIKKNTDFEKNIDEGEETFKMDVLNNLDIYYYEGKLRNVNCINFFDITNVFQRFKRYKDPQYYDNYFSYVIKFFDECKWDFFNENEAVPDEKASVDTPVVKTLTDQVLEDKGIFVIDVIKEEVKDHDSQDDSFSDESHERQELRDSHNKTNNYIDQIDLLDNH